MDKAKFTSHVLLLAKMQKSMAKEVGKPISVLEVSYFLNQNMTPIMSQKYFDELSNFTNNEIDPIESLKKRKNLKILKVLSLILSLNIAKGINAKELEHFKDYETKLLDNIATIGLDRLEQDTLKLQINNLLKEKWKP